MKHLFPVLVVGAGGFVGSALRFMLSVAAQRHSISFPFGTLWANLLGCLVLGVIATVAASTELLSPTARLLLATGLCGGFTTMSSFIYELMQLLREDDYLLAAGYFGVTFLGCAALFWLGSLAAKTALKL
jgi:CrcB protein